MSKQITGIAALSIAAITFAASQSVHATPTTIVDNYIGGNDHGWGDVIGSTSNFNTHSMDVDMLAGNILSVSINTNFAGKGDDHLFDNLTSGNGIGYGDLFLSNSWQPFGTAPYLDDNHSTGTVWSYGFSLDNRWMNESLAGTGTLYSLNSGNNNTDTLLSDDFLTGGTFRNGQEIAVDTSSNGVAAVAGNTSSWNITAGKVNFLIDLTGTSLASSQEIALHWGMTCGNDTIEGAFRRNVPEPGVLALLLAGLMGVSAAVSIRKSS